MLTPRNVEHQVAANIFLRGDKPYLEYPERRRNQTIVLKVDEMKKEILPVMVFIRKESLHIAVTNSEGEVSLNSASHPEGTPLL